MIRSVLVSVVLSSVLVSGVYGQDGAAAAMYSGRVAPLKQVLLEQHGGTAESERSVERSLRWLAGQQTDDGSWSLAGPYAGGAARENRAAATAMALLALAGAGHTHRDGDHRQVVENALRWLVAQQADSGLISSERVAHHYAYTHALASIAVCELLGMTHDQALRRPAQLAVHYAEAAQGPLGGWRYRPKSVGDMSVTAWYVMLLQSALASGLEVDQDRVDKTSLFLDTVQQDDGAEYAYLPSRGATPGPTAKGLLCRQHLGWPRDHEALVRGVDRLADQWMLDAGQIDVYYGFHASQVLRHVGGRRWQAWNERMQATLTALQVDEGPEAGSWDPEIDFWGKQHGGRLFTTCFATCCLEVYYRHKPLDDDAAAEP